MLQTLAEIAGILTPYFLMIAVGYGLKQTLLRQQDVVSAVNRIVFCVAMPCKLFYSTASSGLSGGLNGRLCAFAALSLSVTTLLAWLLARVLIANPRVRGTQIQNAFRCNYTIFGTSIAESFYGAAGLNAAARVAMVAVPLLNIYAVLTLSPCCQTSGGKYSLKATALRLARNPLLIGVLAGTTVGALQIPVPQALLKTASMLGNCATPLAFVLLGATFSFARLRANRLQVIAGTLVRLVLVPLLVLPAAIALGFRDAELLVLFTLCGTPVAVVSHITAREMGADGELASQLVLATSALGLFSMFLFLFALRSMSYLT